MHRVCEEVNISLDGDHDYLTSHGGRRGAGDILYREDPVLAQTALDTARSKLQEIATSTLKPVKRLPSR